MTLIMLNEFISDEELLKARESFNSIKSPTETQRFEFALNLIRSKQRSVIEEGLDIFQRLFANTREKKMKVDALYYMAIGQTKLNNYEQALKLLQSILNVQPANEQVKPLYIEVNRRMDESKNNQRKELIRMTIASFSTRMSSPEKNLPSKPVFFICTNSPIEIVRSVPEFLSSINETCTYKNSTTDDSILELHIGDKRGGGVCLFIKS
ncbi:mitochondrial fission 1 [Brachionus plicatilis]|uniref:Mitochondrial fission 1 n=1 Tax=Brachionus plicatilis TaxID=10195 RepID=A0A3M7S7I9_BRAPC|nr:mitochondrial fission 1 [Brachionus plicatilis]